MIPLRHIRNLSRPRLDFLRGTSRAVLPAVKHYPAFARSLNTTREARAEPVPRASNNDLGPRPPTATSGFSLRQIRTDYNAAGDTWEITAHTRNGPMHIPRRWLRDHCRCSECIHPDTRQRLVDVFQMEHDFRISNCNVEGDKVFVTWQHDTHKSEYELRWLEHAFDSPAKLNDSRGNTSLVSWGPGQGAVRKSPPEVKYEDVMYTDEGLAEWTRKIREIGFCFVDGCPTEPDITEKLLGRLGPIRNTHYGAFWDFTSDLSSKDMAYTSLGLDVHTDTTYFSEAAGLQLFHLLSHEGTGGENQLVDGFAAAEKLRRTRPEAFETLCNTRLMAHASGNEGLSIQPQVTFRTIRLDDLTGQIEQISWNNADRCRVMVEAENLPDGIDRWYKAAHEWNKILQEDAEDTRYEIQLAPGRPLIFDNWRVLHGRSAFTGKRRMCGGYINRDDYIARYRSTNVGYNQVVEWGIY